MWRRRSGATFVSGEAGRMTPSLAEFFAPRSIAVVGASREPGKVGHAVFGNLLAGGYTGRVYPVNPSAGEILGHAAYPSLSAISGVVDLAVIVVPAVSAPAIVEECGRLGIPAAIVISAGFRESGPEGAALERALVSAARAGGVRLLGPNCLGLIAVNPLAYAVAGMRAALHGGAAPSGTVLVES